MATFTITWHTHPSEINICDVCRPMNNATWIFDIAHQPFPRQLVHPTQGIVWDCDEDEPRTHGVGSRRGPWNCRCWLTWAFDLSDVKDRLIGLVAVTETWQRVGLVLVVREQGRFVTWRKA